MWPSFRRSIVVKVKVGWPFYIQPCSEVRMFQGSSVLCVLYTIYTYFQEKIPRNLFPRGFLQGTNVARHLFSKGNGFPSGAIPRVSNSKGIDLHVLHIPREHFPRPNFQGPISKVQFPRSNFHVPISKSQFPSPNFQPPSNQAKRDYLSGNKIILMLGNPPNP